MNKHMIGTVDQILSTRARIQYRYRINFEVIGYDKKNEMNQWCAENCQGNWHSETFYALYWRFEDEQDATMFMLRWGSAEGNKLK